MFKGTEVGVDFAFYGKQKEVVVARVQCVQEKRGLDWERCGL